MTLIPVLRYTNVSVNLQKTSGLARQFLQPYIATAQMAVMRAQLADCSQGGLLSWARMEKAYGKGSLRQHLSARGL